MQTWVLLRGLGRGAAHWSGFAQCLAATLDARVIALDLPGNGALHQQRSPVSIDAMVTSCRQQLAARGVHGPVGLLAISLGGMVATAWATRWPQEIRALVLINTSMRPFSAPWQRLRPAALWHLLRAGVHPPGSHQREQQILALTAHAPRPGVLAHWMTEGQLHPVSRANSLRQLLGAACFRAPARAPQVPLLVLASTLDRLASVQCSRALAAHWGAPLREHPTAGHDLSLDDGPWVSAELRAWLALGHSWE